MGKNAVIIPCSTNWPACATLVSTMRASRATLATATRTSRQLIVDRGLGPVPSEVERPVPSEIEGPPCHHAIRIHAVAPNAAALKKVVENPARSRITPAITGPATRSEEH